MRLNLTGPSKGRNKSVGTEMIAPLWPEFASDHPKPDQYKKREKRKKASKRGAGASPPAL